MKWIVIGICIFLSGCASPQKHRKPVHHHGSKHRKVSTADDAATKALIKSLRE